MATVGFKNADCPRRVVCAFVRKFSVQPSEDIPRITVPHVVVKNIQKAETNKILAKARHNHKAKYQTPLIISCKRSEFNHHKGQTYQNFNPKHLASYAWKHKKSHGDYFTIMSHNSNPSLEADCTGFGDLGLNPEMVAGLNSMEISQPTLIQELAIPKILRGHCVTAAAETGSGKTLAYLCPLVEQILKKNQVSSRGDNPPLNSPQGIILAPSRELADQIMSVAERLSGFCNFKPHSYCGGRGTQAKLLWPNRTEMDILVSTPGILQKLIGKGVIKGHDLGHLVLDEMDTLLDDSFSAMIINIIKQLKVSAGEMTGDTVYTNSATQVVLVGATLPRSLGEILQNVLPVEAFENATTDHVHRLMPHVAQKFLRLRPSSKPESVLRLCKESAEKGIPTIVFCNRASTCSWLSRFLDDNSVECVLMTGTLTGKMRNGRFQSFQTGDQNVLVCTDIGSRGLDTSRVHRVINYEFPGFMSDYIHRAGRAGRIGSQHPGHVISFISHPWDVDLLHNIESAARRMTELHNVNANIKRKLTHAYEQKNGLSLGL